MAPPLWVWPMLVAAVAAVSSAGVVFSTMREVPPLTLAAWRLQLTAALLGVAAARECLALDRDGRRRALQDAGWLAASGVALALHFGLWVASLEATTLTHSLLLVSASPILLAAWRLLSRAPISRGELGAAASGFAGALLVFLAGARAERGATLAGDAMALAAAACFVPYIVIGRRLRRHLPLFVYAAPVTAVAAALLSLGGAAAEGARVSAAGARGVFGWAADAHFAPRVLFLALGPGLVGHTGFNLLLRHVEPLAISLAVTAEPLLGAVMGWAVGVGAPPAAATLAGGAVIVASTVGAVLAAARRERRAREAAGDGGRGDFALVPIAADDPG